MNAPQTNNIMTRLKFPYTNKSLNDFKKANEVRCPKCNKKHAEARGKDVVLEILCKCKTKFVYDNGEVVELVRSA